MLKITFIMNAQNNLHHERSGLKDLKAKLFKSLWEQKTQKGLNRMTKAKDVYHPWFIEE